ncbi:MAG: hypothetical protein J2P36_25365 [Ktedonobacteraceae bacterium]|nr:hypothetical protein [Ktedonobacteraceae bacterium]
MPIYYKPAEWINAEDEQIWLPELERFFDLASTQRVSPKIMQVNVYANASHTFSLNVQVPLDQEIRISSSKLHFSAEIEEALDALTRARNDHLDQGRLFYAARNELMEGPQTEELRRKKAKEGMREAEKRYERNIDHLWGIGIKIFWDPYLSVYRPLLNQIIVSREEAV